MKPSVSKRQSILLFAMLFTLVGHTSQAEQVTYQYTNRVDVIDPDKRFLKELNRNRELIVDHVNSVGYEVYGPNGLPEFLTKKGIQFTTEGANSEKTHSFLADYPTPEEVNQKVIQLQKAYPQFIELQEIGRSVENRPLLVARLTAPNSAGNPIDRRPEFKYVANMHGDEIVGRELLVLLIEDLAKNYGKDAQVTRLMDSIQIYIMPSMNPDGAKRKSRFNARGVDLNRGFPDFTTNDNVNSSTNRAPEVQAMMKFQAQHRFKLSANFHGGAEVVNYPWDTASGTHPLENLVKKLSLDYSRSVPYIYQSKEFKEGITNGYAWYELNGGMQDWSDYWHKDLQVTVELTNSKWPSYASVGKTYLANRPGLLKYIEGIFDLPNR